MAIVKMKKLRAIAMASQREELLRGLLSLGCVEIREPEKRLEDPEWAALLHRADSALARTRTELSAVNTALGALKQYGEQKDGLFVRRRAVSEEQFLSAETVDSARSAGERINGLLRELSRLRTEEARLESRKAGLLPWSDLEIPLDRSGTEHTVFRLVVFPGGTDLNEVRGALSETAAELFEVSAGKQQTCTLLVCHRAEEAAAQEALRPYGFSMTVFPGLKGTAEENITALDAELAANRAAQEKTVGELKDSEKHKDALRLYADRLNAEASKETGAGNLLTDGTILYLEGWVPAENLETVRTYLEESGCAWEASDPVPDDGDNPPVRLKNNFLTKPLNMVTEMYSLPSYYNVDPNPLMAPFFILFYGIMMADMGYGLLMILAGVLVTQKYRPKGTAGHLFGLLTLCGISTFIVGALTGGFFGDFLTQVVKLTTGGDFSLPSLFTPLNDTLMILVGSMCLGFVQILTGMVISFAVKIRRGEVMAAIWDEVTWWVVFAGIGLMAAGVTNLVLYAGLAMVVAGPVATEQGFGKVTGIFGSLYSHVTGYFGDILSYSRLMALMLAGSVIAQVFNTLGAIPGNIVIFFVISMAGNALNFALNLLGCYVHDLRLQCLEYFGKFYEDGGQPFRPVAMETKFVDIERAAPRNTASNAA